MADGHLRTTAVPLKMDGTLETGDARSQIALALENLEKTVKAAGGEMADVIQALCFLTNTDHVPLLNEEWTKAIQAALPQSWHSDRERHRRSGDRDPDSGPRLHRAMKPRGWAPASTS